MLLGLEPDPDAGRAPLEERAARLHSVVRKRRLVDARAKKLAVDRSELAHCVDLHGRDERSHSRVTRSVHEARAGPERQATKDCRPS